MSLLQPTLGDLWDRIEVLHLKIENAIERGRPFAHFIKEHAGIVEEVGKRTKQRPPYNLLTKVAAINAAIWRGIDIMTTCKQVTDANCKQLAQLGVNLQKWNLARVRLKERIDRWAGEFQGEEKV